MVQLLIMVFIKPNFHQITKIFVTFPGRKSKTAISVNSQNVVPVCKNMKMTLVLYLYDPFYKKNVTAIN